MGITHGNLLGTHKRNLTLVMKIGLARSNMYSHAREILALQCALGGSETIVCFTALKH